MRLIALETMGRQGSFLIETIVSLTLVTVGLLGLVALLTRSLVLNDNVKNRFIAATLAAEGIEVIKNIIDSGIAQGRGWGQIDNGVYLRVAYDSNSGSIANNRINSFNDKPSLSEGDLNQLFGSVENLRLDNRGIYNYSGGETTIFKRILRVKSDGNNNTMTVNSYVRWSSRGFGQTINVEDRFYNWRQ